MSLLDPGQSKTDPVSGIAGAIWTALYGDADSNINPGYTPTPPTLAPSPGTLTAAELAIRKAIASGQGAMAAALAGIFSTGTGTIIPGASSGTINDTKVTTASLIIPCIIGAPDATAGEIGAACLVNGVVTITSKANATLTLNVGYFAINK